MSGSTGRNSDIISLRLAATFPAEAPRIFSIIGDEGQWPEVLSPRILKRHPSTKVIAGLPDFSRPEFTIESTVAGCEVALFHDLIKTEEDRKEYRKIWKAWLKVLEKRVSQ